MTSVLWFGAAAVLGVVYLFAPEQFVLISAVSALYTSIFAVLGVNDLLQSFAVFVGLMITFSLVSIFALKKHLKDEEV